MSRQAAHVAALQRSQGSSRMRMRARVRSPAVELEHGTLLLLFLISRMLADPAHAPANHLVEVMTLRERAGRRSEWHARAWKLKPRCRRERAARARRVRGRSARQESAPLDSVQTSTSKRLERLSGSRNTYRSSAPPSLQRAPTARAPRKSKSAFCYSWIYSWPACAPAGQK